MTSKADLMDERKANLPLPDEPPAASDWSSLDARNVNVQPGDQPARASADIASSAGSDPLRGPATAGSVARVSGDEQNTNVAAGLSDVGRTAKDGLEGLPNDAVSREAKNKPGLADTTKADYGCPAKSDPSSGLKTNTESK